MTSKTKKKKKNNYIHVTGLGSPSVWILFAICEPSPPATTSFSSWCIKINLAANLTSMWREEKLQATISLAALLSSSSRPSHCNSRGLRVNSRFVTEARRAECFFWLFLWPISVDSSPPVGRCAGAGRWKDKDREKDGADLSDDLQG